MHIKSSLFHLEFYCLLVTLGLCYIREQYDSFQLYIRYIIHFPCWLSLHTKCFFWICINNTKCILQLSLTFWSFIVRVSLTWLIFVTTRFPYAMADTRYDYVIGSWKQHKLTSTFLFQQKPHWIVIALIQSFLHYCLIYSANDSIFIQYFTLYFS